MATQNGTVWIWFQRLIGGRIWIKGGDKLAVKKKTFFKKATTRKAAAPKKAAATPAVKVKFQPATEKTLKEDVYENNIFCFAVCSPIESGSCEQLSKLFSCREGFIGAFRDSLYNSARLSDKKVTIMVWVNTGNKPKVSHFDNVTYDKWLPDSIKAGLKLVNHFEKRNKWMRTKAHPVKHEYGKNHCLYVFQGSRWWITSSYTLSLFMLLIRLGREAGVKKIAANASTATVIKAIKSTPNGSNHIAEAEKWVVFLDNRRKIFKGRKTFADNFKATGGINSDGILALTNNTARDKEALERFNTHLREAGLSVKRRQT